MPSKRIWIGCLVGAVSLLLLAGSGLAEDTKKAEQGKFNFVLPVYLAEGLQITVNTPASEKLLERASAQCVDETCKERVAACKKEISHCVLVPPREALEENREEAE